MSPKTNVTGQRRSALVEEKNSAARKMIDGRFVKRFGSGRVCSDAGDQ
ncbi:MAG: hypothetical protein WA858_27685 [Xanthobacteraceae bacterium]|jgi:hypothetical protein